MEQEVLRLLVDVQQPEEARRRNAEAQLTSYNGRDEFPIALINIAVERSLELQYRTGALLLLKSWVLSCWSPSLEDWKGPQAKPEVKEEVRKRLFPLITSEERKIRTTSAYVVSKIASSDFPEEWPSLLNDLLAMIHAGNNNETHGALRVLSDIVEDSFSDEQFFAVAKQLVQILYDTAVNESRPHNLRAMAVMVFRSCLEILEMVKADYGNEVKLFLDEALTAWIPFFVNTLDKELHQTVNEVEYQGLTALKIQIIRTIMKIRLEFANTLSHYMDVLFSSTWNELNQIKDRYTENFIENDTEGRLVDADGLPHSLDLFILEELDFIQLCIKSKPVKDAVINQTGTVEGLIYATIILGQITSEDRYSKTDDLVQIFQEALWSIDLNIFLCEETATTTSYTPRTASGDLIQKLSEWLPGPTTQMLWHFTQQIFQSGNRKVKESVLFIWDQVLPEWSDNDMQLETHIAVGLVQFIIAAIRSPGDENVFLRARGYLLAGTLCTASKNIMSEQSRVFFEQTISAATNDPEEVVKISCIKVLQKYCELLPSEVTQTYQRPVINTVATFAASRANDEIDDNQDVLATLAETLKAIVTCKNSIILEPDMQAIELLFTIAGLGPGNPYLASLIQDCFEDICEELSLEQFIPLCEKILPPVIAALDKGIQDEPGPLTCFAVNVLATLTNNASDPLPNGFVAQIFPRLGQLLLTSDETELLQSGSEVFKHIIEHDPKQVLEWHGENGKSGLEVALMVIDRLLGPATSDSSALEVGGLAAEVVERLGDHLGPFLPELLRAVATRLASATTAPFIQSLVLVFARLTITRAKDVVDFLAGLQIGNESGLQVVLTKWLGNSEFFSGYSEIRQNVIALSRLYTLDDLRVRSIIVEGDLIVGKSSRIVTRSQAKSMPQQYTQTPVPLKIIKILIKELGPAADTSTQGLGSVQAASTVESDDEWEDMEEIGFPGSRSELLALAEEGTATGRPQSRVRDDETNAYLIEFFKEIYQKNIGNFEELYRGLTSEEQLTLGQNLS